MGDGTGGGAYVGYFTSDRAVKYGFGVPRLLLVTLFAFEVVPRFFLNLNVDSVTEASVSVPASTSFFSSFFSSAAAASAAAAGARQHARGAAIDALRLAPYLASMRWVGHTYMGSIGAGVNVQVLGFLGNLLMLLVAASACIWDATHDYSILVYLMKTFSGDQLAGKLDTLEWKLVLFFTFGVFGPSLWMLAGTNAEAYAAASPYFRILPLLFVIQAVCEYGDAHMEHLKFFRHRYGFEAFTLAALTCLPGGITPLELRVVQYDLVICLFYRVSNLCIIVYKSGAIGRAVAAVAVVLRKLCFLVFGALSGQRIVNVTDAEVATAVLRASDVKGNALERHVATPAWRPLLSLESVDGPLYESMLKDFHVMMKKLPRPAKLAEIAKRHVASLLSDAETAKRRVEEAARKRSAEDGPSATSGVHEGGAVVDARDIARLSLSVFVEYVFGREWEPAFEPLADASWEWRKEIAVRARADPGLKREAIDIVVNDLIRNNPALWNLFGEEWKKPRYYSLILQPFLISPAINVGDIAVAMKANPELNLEAAMRQMHPFPIFERWVDKDVVVRGKVAVRANTQVMMFTSDFRDSKTPWPAFGVGPRKCAGTTLALGLLQTMHSEMLKHPAFEPGRGHKYSGRNNDGITTPGEIWYFVKTVFPIVFGLRREGEDWSEMERAAANALLRVEGKKDDGQEEREPAPKKQKKKN